MEENLDVQKGLSKKSKKGLNHFAFRSLINKQRNDENDQESTTYILVGLRSFTVYSYGHLAKIALSVGH